MQSSPGNVAVTAMAVWADRPEFVSLGCSDDFVRTYDRRYLARPVFEDVVVASQDAATSENENDPSRGQEQLHISPEEMTIPTEDQRPAHVDLPPSIDNWQGLVHEFCPSHLRRSMFESSREMRDLSVTESESEDDEEQEEHKDDEFDDFGERVGHGLDGEEEEKVRDDNRESFERDDRYWFQFAHNITR
jgi:hypothetical protein